MKAFISIPSGMEEASRWWVVALCRHKLALAGYEFCILTLEEKIAKQKDLPEDVLSGGSALTAKGFSRYLCFSVLAVTFHVAQAPSSYQSIVFTAHGFPALVGCELILDLMKWSLPLFSVCSWRKSQHPSLVGDEPRLLCSLSPKH